jgi:cation:H+ antiporter
VSGVALVAVGLVVLAGGAEAMVRGAVAVATRLGVPSIVVGLTVVSLGTSLPELAVGLDAVYHGSPALAVGNIVGTNLVNLLLVLGLSALLVPVALDRPTLRRDLPAMTLAALLLGLLSADGNLGTLDGLVLCLTAVAYTALVLRDSLGGGGGTGGRSEVTAPRRSLWVDVVLLVGGVLVVILGAELLVDGAVELAQVLGLSEAVIGLTVLAVGTSAPELVTTMVSTVRGNRDVALGNLIGSSTYNIALVLGITVLSAPDGVPVAREVLGTDLLLLVVVAVMCVPVFVSGRRIGRLEGGAAVALYLGYLGWLVATAT